MPSGSGRPIPGCRLDDALDDAQNVLVLGRSCASWGASSSGDPMID
jgi:hypothetical protein